MRQLKISQSITTRESQSLDRYLSEIGKIPLLDIGEEAVLAQKIREGDEEALERLTKGNLRFVVSVAKQYQNQGLSLGDLINEGNTGLIKAAKRFDETKGFKFISFAVWWIRQAILVAIPVQARAVRLPLNQVVGNSKMNKVHSKLEQELGREPSAEEIAMDMNINVHIVHDLFTNSRRHVSFDAPFVHGKDAEDFSLLDIVENDEVSPEQGLLDDSLQTEIFKSLSILSERERTIIIKFFGLHNTPAERLEDIADDLKLTRERARQIKDKALGKLRRTSHTKTILKGYR